MQKRVIKLVASSLTIFLPSGARKQQHSSVPSFFPRSDNNTYFTTANYEPWSNYNVSDKTGSKQCVLTHKHGCFTRRYGKMLMMLLYVAIALEILIRENNSSLGREISSSGWLVQLLFEGYKMLQTPSPK